VLLGKIEDFNSIADGPKISHLLDFLKNLAAIFLNLSIFHLLGVGSNLKRLIGKTAHDALIILLLSFFNLEDGSPIDAYDIEIRYVALRIELILDHPFNIDS
jgi:hypothetical protein